MSFSSKDRNLVEAFAACAGVTAKIRQRRRVAWGKEWVGYEVGFSSVRLARWFQEIGIGPRKSLTLGALRVPDDYFFDAVRGLLDGDGSIARYTDSRGRHCFSLRFYCGSETHLRWLRQALNSRLGVDGSLVGTIRPRGLSQRPIFQLQYRRRASEQIANVSTYGQTRRDSSGSGSDGQLSSRPSSLGRAKPPLQTERDDRSHDGEREPQPGAGEDRPATDEVVRLRCV